MLGALALASATAHAANDFDLAQLMQLLARGRPGEATFTERREVAMLDKPMELSGTLSFEPPDTFVRETLKPRRERIAIAGNTLTMSQGGRSRTMSLDAAPEAALVVDAIRGTLLGDRATLERHFDPSVAGSAERWTLALVPRDGQLRGKVDTVVVRGEQAVVQEVQVRMPGGDRSVMTIEPAASGAAR